MTLHLYNTLTRGKEPFQPLDPDHVRMYVCGPTVYDFAHIGNARPVVVFDVLSRLLRRLYPPPGKVTYVRNITDVDDKIIAKARETGEDVSTITEHTTRMFHQDMAALGALPPDIEPRATGHIPQMIQMIETLIGGGHAYEADGHVLFSVASWDGYGRLSKLNRDELVAGARVEVAPYKKDPADFVLWKPSAADLPGWESPWGRGRPGWHLECSAMSKHHLGDTFDIHGGGQDLLFPHHENEIAQSRCANHTGFMARTWVHNGYLMTEGEKMSKSLGNFYTVHDLLAEFPGEAVRLMLLKTHYRQPLDFTKAGVAEAKKDLDRFYGALRRARKVEAVEPKDSEIPLKEFKEALCDDLNTPLALLHLHGRMNNLNINLRPDSPGGERAQQRDKWLLLEMGKWLGFLGQDPDDWLKGRPAGAHLTLPGVTMHAESSTAPAPAASVTLSGVKMRAESSSASEGHQTLPSLKSGTATITEVEIDSRIADRKRAKAEKDFATADRIRDELEAEGIILEDKPGGITDWRRK